VHPGHVVKAVESASDPGLVGQYRDRDASLIPTYPWSTMIVPSRSRRIPGRERESAAVDVDPVWPGITALS
jgi:hypothetical protein